MKSKIVLAVLALGLLSSTANAGPEPAHTMGMKSQGYAMGDKGRFHGYLGTGGLIPKCNPHVSPECARLYPCLLKGLDYCMALRAARRR